MSERLFRKDRSWLARVRAFRDAFRGLRHLFATQANARIHALGTAIVVGLGWWLEVSNGEWLFLIAAIGFVWTAEAFNTAIEYLVDLVSPQIDPRAGLVKDLAAAAVLCAAASAATIGFFIFAPKLLQRL